MLLERRDIDVNSGGSKRPTLLIYAVWKGRKAVVKFLLERNDINVNAFFTPRLTEPQTALSLALNCGHHAVVEILTQRDDLDASPEIVASMSYKL
jgi:ankyrin repeat protein